MIVHAFFGLFIFPTEPYGSVYGSVSGDIKIDDSTKEGNEVRILNEGEGDWFSGSLKIISISKSYMKKDGKLLLSLDGIVAPTREDAIRLCGRLNKETVFFCDPYLDVDRVNSGELR